MSCGGKQVIWVYFKFSFSFLVTLMLEEVSALHAARFAYSFPLLLQMLLYRNKSEREWCSEMAEGRKKAASLHAALRPQGCGEQQISRVDSVFSHLQMRTKLPVLDLMLTTNFRHPRLQEITIVNMKKWMRKDTQEKILSGSGSGLASLICVEMLSDQETQ